MIQRIRVFPNWSLQDNKFLLSFNSNLLTKNEKGLQYNSVSPSHFNIIINYSKLFHITFAPYFPQSFIALFKSFW